MKKEKSFGQNSVATSAQNGLSIYFDCATNSCERGVVYDEMTPEKLRDWFKATKFKPPVRVMGDDNFRAFIRRDDDGYYLAAFRWDWKEVGAEGEVTDKWTLRIGKRFTETRWFGITRFITEYITGELQEQYNWSESKTLRLI